MNLYYSKAFSGLKYNLYVCKGFDLNIKKGRSFDPSEREAVCFDTGYKIGDKINVKGTEYTVVGLLACPLHGTSDFPQVVVPPSNDVFGDNIDYVVFDYEPDKAPKISGYNLELN